MSTGSAANGTGGRARRGWAGDWARRGTRRRRTVHGRTRRVMRRRAMHDRTVMMPARRRRRAPGVDNHRVHDWRLLGRLDARAVAMRADRRSVGVRHDPRAVADRAKRSVDVIAVDPRSGRRTADRENERRRRQNRQDVLVHVTPRFLVYRKLGEQVERF